MVGSHTDCINVFRGKALIKLIRERSRASRIAGECERQRGLAFSVATSRREIQRSGSPLPRRPLIAKHPFPHRCLG